MLNSIKQEALTYSEPERIALYQKYFQCKKDGYGEGDQFAGIRNPPLRMLSKKHRNISLEEVTALLCDPIHEIRLLALFILVLQYNNKKTTHDKKREIVDLYLSHINYINNWDLVDSSAHYIVGNWVFHNNENQLLVDLAHKNHLWSNRIAIIATFYHIRQNEFEIPMAIAEILLSHRHDIIHKGVGWMLREIGNRSRGTELRFLELHYNEIPRTALRYAIEKFEEPRRTQILKGQL